jgi:hypothetical protein
MIVGSGSISKLLNDREEFIFFASGVSNSQETSPINTWLREAKLLLSFRDDDRMFVYFSSISIFTTDTNYTSNKRTNEWRIRSWFKNYTIIRLGNVWECTNPNTFINAYKREPYKPREELKYMISKKQLNFITDNLPSTGKHEISIFGELITVSECLKRAK